MIKSWISDTPPQPAAEAGAIDPLGALRILRSAGGDLLTQASLYAQLARVEWEEEKRRLQKMLLASLFGFACLLCLMLFVGALVMVLVWDTGYRVPAVLAMMALYGIGLAVAWRSLQRLSALSSAAFAATREELAADIALLRGLT